MYGYRAIAFNLVQNTYDAAAGGLGRHFIANCFRKTAPENGSSNFFEHVFAIYVAWYIDIKKKSKQKVPYIKYISRDRIQNDHT